MRRLPRPLASAPQHLLGLPHLGLPASESDGSREVAPRSSYKYFSIQVLSMELRPKAEHQKIVDVAKLLRSACTIQGDSSKAGYRDCGLP